MSRKVKAIAAANKRLRSKVKETEAQRVAETTRLRRENQRLAYDLARNRERALKVPPKMVAHVMQHLTGEIAKAVAIKFVEDGGVKLDPSMVRYAVTALTTGALQTSAFMREPSDLYLLGQEAFDSGDIEFRMTLLPPEVNVKEIIPRDMLKMHRGDRPVVLNDASLSAICAEITDPPKGVRSGV